MSRIFVIFGAAAVLAAPLAFSAPASARPVHPCAMNPPHAACMRERMILCRNGSNDAALACSELAPGIGSAGGGGLVLPAPQSFERARQPAAIPGSALWPALNPQPIPPVDRGALNPQPIPPVFR